MRLFALWIGFASLFAAGTANAHEIRPAYLEITEKETGELVILWKQPTAGSIALPLYPEFSQQLLVETTPRISHTDFYLLKEWSVSKPGISLDGLTVRVKGLEQSITDVLLQVNFKNGQVLSQIIRPDNPAYVIEVNEASAIPVFAYLPLGFEHIIVGIDHLLFVLGLLLFVNNRQKLVLAISSFTLGHSVTLGLATLDVASINQSVAEAIIALSIVFMAVELANLYRGKISLAYHCPWLIAFIFGLVHGFGFAGALSGIGLPKASVAWALFLFNVGVELGQLLCVAVLLVLGWCLSRWLANYLQPLRWTITYAMGTLATFWFLERITLIL